jgi:hypothetical protein
MSKGSIIFPFVRFATQILIHRKELEPTSNSLTLHEQLNISITWHGSYYRLRPKGCIMSTKLKGEVTKLQPGHINSAIHRQKAHPNYAT